MGKQCSRGVTEATRRLKMRGVFLTLLKLRAAAPIKTREERVVGIVGSGVGRALATAHFLRESRPDLRVIVFERDAVIGGRARTVDLGGRRVDLGATAISTLNHYLLNFTAGMKRASDGGPSTLGIFDGAGFRFQSSEGTLPLAAHLTRALRPRLAEDHTRREADGFETEVASTSCSAAASPSRRPPPFSKRWISTTWTQVSAYDYFRRIGLPSKFIHEFIDGASRDNYNQDGSLNALADLVSLAGAGLAGDVFELQEGTAQIPQRVLQGTDVRLNTRVAAVRLHPSQLNYAILDATGTRDGCRRACRRRHLWNFANISLPADVSYRPRPYQPTYVALASGRLSRAPSATRGRPRHCINGRNYQCQIQLYWGSWGEPGGDPIYKIMSRQRLSDSELDAYAFEAAVFISRAGGLECHWRLHRPGPHTWC